MTQPALADILTFARAQLGKPYIADAARFGPDHYDCSGLVYAVFAHFGVPIPTTSSADLQWGIDHASVLSVADAMHYPCALVIHGGLTGYGSAGHVALAVGDGRTIIEARGHAYGVIEDDATARLGTFFTDALLVPGVPWTPTIPDAVPTPTSAPPRGDLATIGRFVAACRARVLGEGVGIPTPDPAVRLLQGLLTREGCPCAGDGQFGPMTDRAVRDFQTLRHLTVDGIVGPRTWAALLGPG